ncbi:hypothetical protein B0H17DRAFT_1105921 [Mycena rosella]|uniref:BTB domain-containing protein n=1 Tax=Mycena rosella TaxID=1033263 RepID=A0AAD7C6E8_MYCRO|nr:hypothetical protein B0H17DRAFT_1105921 [Mycena rosella]
MIGVNLHKTKIKQADMKGTALPASSPARRRTRPNSFDADPDVTLIDVDPATSVAKIIRDSVHYNTSGDCKIRVKDTLFCIHRFLPERASSTFQTMFQLPQGAENPQDSSDDDPIVLTGDTVEEFCILCWAL